MTGVFNLAQLTGSRLEDWKPGHSTRPGEPSLSPLAPPIVQPEEKHAMTFRSEIRAAIADAGTMTFADLKAKFADQQVATPLCQMANAGQIKRKGSGTTAVYSIGSAGGKPGPKPGKARRSAVAAPKIHRSARKTRGLDLPAITRGGHIEGAIAELRRRIGGLEQAITVLENLA